MSDLSCEHGSLARSCEICVLYREVERLRAENERLQHRCAQWKALMKSHERVGKENHFLRNEVERLRRGGSRMAQEVLKLRAEDKRRRGEDGRIAEALANLVEALMEEL